MMKVVNVTMIIETKLVVENERDAVTKASEAILSVKGPYVSDVHIELARVIHVEPLGEANN